MRNLMIGTHFVRSILATIGLTLFASVATEGVFLSPRPLIAAEPKTLVRIQPPKLQGIPIVANGSSLPQSIRDANPNAGVLSSAHWESMLIYNAYPTIIGDLATAFETHGVMKGKQELGAHKAALAVNLIRAFTPREDQTNYFSKEHTEFEQIRFYRKFADDYETTFENLKLTLPLRIGFVAQAPLGEYDATKGAFPITDHRGKPPIPGTKHSDVQYHDAAPRSALTWIPVEPDKAESFLESLEDRKVIVFATYSISDIAGTDQGKTIVTLTDEIYAAYHPQDLSKPILTQRRTAPSVEITDLKPEENASTSLDERMSALCLKHQLYSLNGIPVFGNSVYSYNGWPREKQQFAYNSQAKFHDHLVMGYFPHLIEHTDPGNHGAAIIPFFARHVKPTEMAKYARIGGRVSWKGDSEFEQRSSREQFLNAYREQFLKMGITGPLKFYIASEVHIRPYDFEKQGFPISYQSTSSKDVGVAKLSSFAPRSDSDSISMPVAFEVPEIWKLSEAEAQAMTKKLQSGPNNFVNFRSAIGLIEVTVPDASHVMPPPADISLSPWNAFGNVKLFGYATSNLKLFRDINLTEHIADIEIEKAPLPALLTKQAAPGDDPLYLSKPLARVGLIARDASSFLSDDDWTEAIQATYAADTHFYQNKLVKSEGPLEHNNTSYTISNPTSDHFFQPGYTPFFPKGFPADRLDQVTLTDEQRQIFKDWAVDRTSQSQGLATVPCYVQFDPQQNQLFVSHVPYNDSGSGQSASDWIKNYFRNSKDIGDVWCIGKVTTYSTTRKVNPSAQALVLPAVASRLCFALTKDFQLHNENGHAMLKSGKQYRADLEVRIQKIDHYPARDSRPSCIAFYAEPHRIQVYEYSRIFGTNQEIRTSLFAEGPVAIAPFTVGQWEEEKALEEKQNRENLEAEKAAQKARFQQKAKTDQISLRRNEYSPPSDKEQMSEDALKKEHVREIAALKRKLDEQIRNQETNFPRQFSNSYTAPESNSTRNASTSVYLTIGIGLLGTIGIVLIAYFGKAGSLLSSALVVLSVLARGAKAATDKGKVKIIELNELRPAFLALGKKAYQEQIACSDLEDRFLQIRSIEQEIRQKRNQTRMETDATSLDKAKSLANSAADQVAIERLRQNQKDCFIAIGKTIVNLGSLHSEESLKVEIQKALQVLDKMAKIESVSHDTEDRDQY